MEEQPESCLADIRERLDRFAASLPTHVAAAEIGVRQKAPYKALVVRGALMWRTEETGRSACDMLARGDIASGVLLTRATLENAALLWRLRDLIRDRSKSTHAEIDQLLMQMLVGSKRDPSIEAINILTAIDRVSRAVPNIRNAYDILSEYAHPNFSGVAGLYSYIQQEKLTTRFGKREGYDQKISRMAAPFLRASLLAFEMAYNNISDLMPVWISEMEPL